ncbi:MAG: hypothetical protein ACTSX0_02665 [Promethearchaeota archaeon]
MYENKIIFEINLTKVERGIREAKVRVERKGKVFYRRQRVGRKSPERKYRKNYYKDRFKSYDSLPAKIDISKDRIIKQSIDRMVKYSGDTGRESITTFSVKDNKIERAAFKNSKKSDEVSLPRTKFNFGSIHTHPNTSVGGAFNCPSKHDLITFIWRENEKFKGVQSVGKSGKMGDTWIAVKTDTFDYKTANKLAYKSLEIAEERLNNELRPKLAEAIDYPAAEAHKFFDEFDNEVAKSQSKFMKSLDSSKMIKIYCGKLNNMKEIKDITEDDLFDIIMSRRED